MDAISDLSSNATSRTEHMAYLKNELGLDRPVFIVLKAARKRSTQIGAFLFQQGPFK